MCWIHTEHETEKSLASSEDSYSVNTTCPKSTSSALNKAAELNLFSVFCLQCSASCWPSGCWHTMFPFATLYLVFGEL